MQLRPFGITAVILLSLLPSSPADDTPLPPPYLVIIDNQKHDKQVLHQKLQRLGDWVNKQFTAPAQPPTKNQSSPSAYGRAHCVRPDGYDGRINFRSVAGRTEFRKFVEAEIEVIGRDSAIEDDGDRVTIEGRSKEVVISEVPITQTVRLADGTMSTKTTTRTTKGIQKYGKGYIAYGADVIASGSPDAFNAPFEKLAKYVRAGRGKDWAIYFHPREIPEFRRQQNFARFSVAEATATQMRDGESETSYLARKAWKDAYRNGTWALWNEVDHASGSVTMDTATSPFKAEFQLVASDGSELANLIRQLPARRSLPAFEPAEQSVANLLISINISPQYQGILSALLQSTAQTNASLAVAMQQIEAGTGYVGSAELCLTSAQDMLLQAVLSTGGQVPQLAATEVNPIWNLISAGHLEFQLPTAPGQQFPSVSGSIVAEDDHVAIKAAHASTALKGSSPASQTQTLDRFTLMSLKGDFSVLADVDESESVRRSFIALEKQMLALHLATKQSVNNNMARRRQRMGRHEPHQFVSCFDRISDDGDWKFDISVTCSGQQVVLKAQIGSELMNLYRVHMYQLGQAQRMGIKFE